MIAAGSFPRGCGGASDVCVTVCCCRRGPASACIGACAHPGAGPHMAQPSRAAAGPGGQVTAGSAA